MSLFRQWFCRHEWMWYRNIYGDEIIHSGYKRSIWGCVKCHKIQYRADLFPAD